MSNPVFDMFNKPSQGYDLSQYKGLYNMMSSAPNPMQAIYQIAGNNPQLQPILQMINNGGNPEQMARAIMKQRGINPDDFIRALGSLKG